MDQDGVGGGGADRVAHVLHGLGYEVVEIEKQEIKDIAVSSTKVRAAPEKGDVTEG